MRTLSSGVDVDAGITPSRHAGDQFPAPGARVAGGSEPQVATQMETGPSRPPRWSDPCVVEFLKGRRGRQPLHRRRVGQRQPPQPGNSGSIPHFTETSHRLHPALRAKPELKPDRRVPEVRRDPCRARSSRLVWSRSRQRRHQLPGQGGNRSSGNASSNPDRSALRSASVAPSTTTGHRPSIPVGPRIRKTPHQSGNEMLPGPSGAVQNRIRKRARTASHSRRTATPGQTKPAAE